MTTRGIIVLAIIVLLGVIGIAYIAYGEPPVMKLFNSDVELGLRFGHRFQEAHNLDCRHAAHIDVDYELRLGNRGATDSKVLTQPPFAVMLPLMCLRSLQKGPVRWQRCRAPLRIQRGRIRFTEYAP